MRRLVLLSCGAWVIAGGIATQTRSQPDWTAVEDETMRHYQALLRLDTSNPAGSERLVVDYLAGMLKREGIPFDIRSANPDRPNLVARLKESGRKRPSSS